MFDFCILLRYVIYCIVLLSMQLQFIMVIHNDCYCSSSGVYSHTHLSNCNATFTCCCINNVYIILFSLNTNENGIVSLLCSKVHYSFTFHMRDDFVPHSRWRFEDVESRTHVCLIINNNNCIILIRWTMKVGYLNIVILQ
jgi:hypothetical protein